MLLFGDDGDGGDEGCSSLAACVMNVYREISRTTGCASSWQRERERVNELDQALVLVHCAFVRL